MTSMTKWFGIVAIAAMLTACGAERAEQAEATHAETSHAHNGDLREVTSSVTELPGFLQSQKEEIRIVYEAAGRAAEMLQWMPCYCGCGESAGHTSNLNCFIHEIRDDGSVEWDDHGTRCGVCLTIAAESIGLKQQGKSDKEIRAFIDSKYESGYAAPTKTRMPV